MRSLSNAAAVALLVCLFETTASAGIIYSNGSSIHGGALANSDFTRPAQWADDFVLSSTLGTTITRVDWRGIYNREGVGVPLPEDDFTLRIFDVGDASPPTPATSPIYEVHLGSVARTDSGINWGDDWNVYEYDAFVPAVTLSPGTRYWLSIVNDTTISNYWQWSMTENFGSNSASRPSDAAAWGYIQYFGASFQLGNDVQAVTVPEPGSATLWGIALVCGVVSLRRNFLTRWRPHYWFSGDDASPAAAAGELHRYIAGLLLACW